MLKNVRVTYVPERVLPMSPVYTVPGFGGGQGEGC